MNPPIDADVRSTALNTAESFCVSAPAGSGKTALLTQRILALLSQVQEPEGILAITFTKKAAEEMRQRVIEALHQAKSGVKGDDVFSKQRMAFAQAALAHSHQKNWQLLEQPYRLKIQTIDSLCLQLAHRMPTISGINNSMSISVQPSIYYQQAVYQFFLALNNSPSYSHALTTLLAKMDNRWQYVSHLLCQLLAKRDQWIEPLKIFSSSSEPAARYFLENSIANVITPKLQALHKILTPYESLLMKLVHYASHHAYALDNHHALAVLRSEHDLPATQIECLTLWQAIAHLLLTQKGDYRRRLDKNCGFPTGQTKIQREQSKHYKLMFTEELIPALEKEAHIQPLLKTILELPNARYSDAQWELLHALFEVLPKLNEQLIGVFQNQQTVDYTEVALGALRALGSVDEPSEQLLMLDHKLQHLLVDEFQDTSHLQFKLLNRLSQGFSPGDGRTVFVVGDAMQSCYGFRDANVGIFLSVKKQGLDHVRMTPLDLKVNFRSQSNLVQWNNTIFSHCFPKDTDIALGAVPFAQAYSQKPPQIKQKVGCYGIDGSQLDNADSDFLSQAEAVYTIHLLKQDIQQNPSHSRAILVRSRSHLTHILKLLKQHQLIGHAHDLDALSSRPFINDLMNLTRSLVEPTHHLAWLGLLRSPMIGLSLNDLTGLCNAPNVDIWSAMNQSSIVNALSNKGQSIIERITPILKRAYHYKACKPLRSWIEGVWLALGGHYCINDNELDDAEVFFNLLEEHCHGQVTLDFEQLVTALDQTFVNHRASQLADVHIMTIHKAKGLEFDTVIVPGLWKSSQNPKNPLLLWHDPVLENGDLGFLLSPLTLEKSEDNRLYPFLKNILSQREQFEQQRLLYIAFTRAKQSLHVLFASPDKKMPIDSKNLLGSIYGAAESTIEWIEAQGLIAGNKFIKNKPNLTRLLYKNENTNLYPDPVNKSTLASSFALPQLSVDDNDYARCIGIVIHNSLEQITVQGIQHWSTDQFSKARQDYWQSLWQVQLKQLKVWSCTLREQLCTSIYQGIYNTLADPTGRWVLDHSHDKSQVEWPISIALDDGTIKRLVIDRTFVDQQGVRYLIDYKTASPLLGETISAFITRSVEAYQGQLELYAQALTLLDRRPIKKGIYFTHLGQLVIK